MSWTTPRTWVTDEVPTAAHFNAHIRDNMDHVYGAVTTFTPTVSQPGSISLTTAVGRYIHVGDTCWLHVFADFAATGTGGNAITIGAVPAAVASRVAGAFGSAGEVDTGDGYYFDSGTALYRCISVFATTTTIVLYDRATSATSTALGVAPATAIATADSLGVTILYETGTPSA